MTEQAEAAVVTRLKNWCYHNDREGVEVRATTDVQALIIDHARLLAALAAKDQQQTCAWHLDDVGGDSQWETSCQNAFEFTDGGPLGNGQRFCGYCGKHLIETRTSDTEAADADE